MKVLKILFVAVFFIAFSCKVQEKGAGKKKQDPRSALRQAKEKADLAMEAEDYRLALSYLQPVDSLINTDVDALFQSGMCHYHLGQYDSAQVYFNKIVDFPDQEQVPIDAHFYQGKNYYKREKTDSALTKFNFLRDTLAILKEKRFLNVVDDEVLRCHEMKRQKKNAVKWEVEELGGNINSRFSDHSPVINGDETVLIFTSKRAGLKDPKTGEFLEDIYISYKKDGMWTAPVGISDSINTPEHEASIALSADGQQLFIYKGEEKGSIYVSKLEGDEWTTPKKLGSNINSSARETHASMSADGKYLYFTSDRKGGYGGTDIYVSKRLADGTWGEAKNLGYGVNSQLDEEGPYIHPDGKTLYFSSKGHNSIGGFDIFHTERNEFDTWTKPISQSYPINTVNDDVFFVLSPNGQRAYYASQAHRAESVSDIYLGNLPDAAERSLTIIIGHVMVPCGNLPNVTITVSDMENDEIAGIYVPNSKTGKFIFFLNRGRDYEVVVEANDEEVHTETLRIDADAKYQQLIKNIALAPLIPCPEDNPVVENIPAKKIIPKKKKLRFEGDDIEYDEAIAIRNIVFPSGSANIRSDKSLDVLAVYLKNNPKALVEIGGHSDSQGAESTNYKVARKRASSAKSYLLRKGVPASQLKVVSYGPSDPIAINRNPNGRYNKVAMRFNRRVEFKVLKQGKSKLKILPIDQVPEKWRVKRLAKTHF